jgi:tRNA(Ile)-lysidine synthase
LLAALAESMADVSKKKKLLVGVSGGRDSMVLLHALLAAGFKNLVICHLNHTLRGRSSDADARLVQKKALSLGLPIEHARSRTAEFAASQKKSLELAARELRMAFFEECSTRAKTKSLVLAHHADDQVETCLFNFLRGTGTAGLGGMRPVSQLGKLTVHRPLLGVTRTQIEVFRKQHKVLFREDATNAGLEHTRNKIRHRVLPLLAEVMSESYRAAILRAAEILRGEEDLIASLMPPTQLELDCKELRAMHPAMQSRVVLRWLRECGVSEAGYAETRRVLSLLDVANGPSKVNLPGNHHARRRSGVLFLESGVD